MIDAIKSNAVRHEEIVVTDVPISYAVFHAEADTPDLAFYDEHGAIYIPEELLQFNEQYAHLFALHEHVEVQHKRAQRSHAYAHRRALLAEFLAAKQLFADARQIEEYLQWRIGLYPAWKNLDCEAIVAQLTHLLAADRPRRGELLQLIKDHAL